MTTTLPRWTTIAANDRAAGAPITGWLMSALDDNLEHARVVCYDPEIHTAATAHDHDGANSAHLSGFPGTESLVRWGIVSTTNADTSRASLAWVTHDVAFGANGWAFGGKNQWITSALIDADRPPLCRAAFGIATDLVISCYVQRTATLTAGSISIGLVDGGADPKDDAKTFVEGTKITAHYALAPLSTDTPAWQRVYGVVRDVAGKFEKAVRVCVQCEETPEGGAIVVNAIDVRPGRQLDYWAPSYNTDWQQDWCIYGVAGTSLVGPPIFDSAMALTNAVRLAPQ